MTTTERADWISAVKVCVQKTFVTHHWLTIGDSVWLHSLTLMLSLHQLTRPCL